jgi:hypothetical protein
VFLVWRCMGSLADALQLFDLEFTPGALEWFRARLLKLHVLWRK